MHGKPQKIVEALRVFEEVDDLSGNISQATAYLLASMWMPRPDLHCNACVQASFRAGLQQMGVTMDDADFTQLVDAIDDHGMGVINTAAFAECIGSADWANTPRDGSQAPARPRPYTPRDGDIIAHRDGEEGSQPPSARGPTSTMQDHNPLNRGLETPGPGGEIDTQAAVALWVMWCVADNAHPSTGHACGDAAGRTEHTARGHRDTTRKPDPSELGRHYRMEVSCAHPT